MGLGVNALESLLNRISKKSVFGNQPISVVTIEEDGTVNYPENCSKGILLVPHRMTETEWELQNAIDDQNGKASLS